MSTNDAANLQTYIEIRPAEAGDAAKIAELISRVWSEFGCVLDTTVEERYLLEPDTHFQELNGEFWVAESGSAVVATCAVGMIDDLTAELKALYVDRRFRRGGWGRKLVKMAIELAKNRGAREIMLWSDTRFTNAHSLYESMGFTKNGARSRDDINRSTEYRFTRPLA